jgi:hypothetical protein
MATTLSILCVHGVGHGDTDASLAPSWTDAISTNLRRWSPTLQLDFEFLHYDDLFDHAPLDGKVYAAALARLLASGLVHGLSDVFPSTRGLFDETVRKIKVFCLCGDYAVYSPQLCGEY